MRCGYSAARGGALHEARRAPSGLVLVDAAVGRRLVDALLREAHGLGRVLVTGVDRGRGDLGAGLELRTPPWLRTRRRSFDRFRLIWLLMFAMTRATTPKLDA